MQKIFLPNTFLPSDPIENPVSPVIRISLFFIILHFISCTAEKPKLSRNTVLALGAVSALNSYNSDCRNYSGKTNPLYTLPDYRQKFLQYRTASYKNLVIGDSTMDISSRYSGFLSSNSVSLAVSGNTLCDMAEQYEDILPLTDSFFISTGGGNDLLKKISLDRIENSANRLFSILKKKAGGKGAVAGIHPTRIDDANRDRVELNRRIQKLAESYSICFISAENLIRLDPDGKASQEDMLDSIHYNENISFAVKSRLSSVCGLTL